MRTILYQGRPTPYDDWSVLPERSVQTYKNLGYQTRELVLRTEAEQAKVDHFDAAVAQSAQVAAERGANAVAEKIRALALRKTAKARVAA